MNLQDGHHEPDLHWYMRSLEDVAVATMESLGVNAPGRVDGLTGAWANTRGMPGDVGTQSRHPKDGGIEGREHKLAAIGVRARRWVTYHGMALNVDPDLRHFRAIVPCGIGDRPVGSVAQMLRGVGGIVSQLDDGLGPPTTSDDDAWSADEALMRRCRAAMLDGFEDVFSVSLRPIHGTPFVVEGDDGRDDVGGTMALSRMKKAELVAEAATRGLNSAGTVQELRERLKMARLSG
jgi:lipoyl(octanoyl) transferase